MNYQIYSGQADSLSGKSFDKRSILLAASSLFIFGCFMGCAIYRYLGIGESELYDNLIERYFLALFYKCTSPLDVIRVALDCTFNELWMFIAVYFAGFTLFSPFVGGALLLYRGVLFGFALTMLQFSNKTGLLLDSMVYLVSSFAVSMLLAVMATQAFGFYYPAGRVRLRSIRTGRYTLTFLRISALVILNVTAMLFLIYVYI